MRLGWIGWTEDRLRHIWKKHKVSPSDLREAFVEPDYKPVFRRTRQGRYTVMGTTTGGRDLCAVMEVVYRDAKPGMTIYELRDTPLVGDDPGKGDRGAFIITAYDLPDKQREWLEEMRRKT